MNPIYSRRRKKDAVLRWLCVGAALFGVTWLALILFTLFFNGLKGLNLELFTQNTPPPGSNEGGLLNAITGSLIMTAIGVGIGAPLGLFAGTYLAEYGRDEPLPPGDPFLTHILLRARAAALAGHQAHRLSGGALRSDHRRAAGDRARRRGDRAAAFHGALQSVLQPQPDKDDGESPGDDQQFRTEPLRLLEAIGLERGPDHHAHRTRSQHRCAYSR